MVNAIAAAAPAFTGENSIVLYQNVLPERYSVLFPFIEIIPPEDSESIFESQAGNEDLCYDRQGHMRRLFQKGQLINTYF